jgi:GNAT superfamily N-acetyltransferase
MAQAQTEGGVDFDRRRLDRIEARFWRGIWDSVPPPAAAEHGVEARDFGPVQATLVSDLGQAGMLNLLLGATEPDAVAAGHLEAAVAWARERGVSPYVPITPDLPETPDAERWLRDHGFEPHHGQMRFVRDSHSPRFRVREDVEVLELTGAEEDPFGMVAATGFGMPAWSAALFAGLPGQRGWRCYAARVEGEIAACGAMVIDDEIAELGVGATLEPARRRGCQLALLRRRIEDAIAAGCRTLLVETGERVEDRPAGSYRNILRAGFEEAYLCPNWRQPT